MLLQLVSQLLSCAQLSAETRLSGIDSLAVLTLSRQLRLAEPSLSLKPQEVGPKLGGGKADWVSCKSCGLMVVAVLGGGPQERT